MGIDEMERRIKQFDSEIRELTNRKNSMRDQIDAILVWQDHAMKDFDEIRQIAKRTELNLEVASANIKQLTALLIKGHSTNGHNESQTQS